MQQRGRRSVAALSVVAGTIDGRPKAPAELTKGQREIWERTVANEAADMFRTAACQDLLANYCRHVSTACSLGDLIDDAEAEGLKTESDLATYERLLKMRDRETRACLAIGTKLRITNQSRYTEKTAATAAKHATDRKLWDRPASAA